MIKDETRLVGIARERVLEQDASMHFHRQQAGERQARIDADREAFLAKGGEIRTVPPGATGVTIGAKEGPGAVHDRIIAASVERSRRQRAESGQKTGRIRKALCDARRAEGGEV